MKGIYDELEQKLRLHAVVRKEIYKRKLEIQYQPKEVSNPTRVQTSTGNSDPVGRLVADWLIDPEITRLSRETDIIEKFLNELDDTPRKVLEFRYMKDRKYSWKEIGEKLTYAPSHCQDMRKKALDQLAHRLG